MVSIQAPYELATRQQAKRSYFISAAAIVRQRIRVMQNLCPVQPTAGKACSLQSAHQIGYFAGSLPDDPGLVIGDHAQDRPLVNAEIITINPAYAPINSASFKADMGITEAGAE